MSIVAQNEADLSITGINNLLERHYEAGWKYSFDCRPSCALYYIISGMYSYRRRCRSFRCRYPYDT